MNHQRVVVQNAAGVEVPVLELLHGAPNAPVNTLEFIQIKRELMTKVLHRVDTGQPLDLRLKVEAVPGPKPPTA